MSSNTRQSAQSNADEPLFLIAAREAAAKRGVSLEEVLATDRNAAEVPEFPTSDCLLPEEAEDFLRVKENSDDTKAGVLNPQKAEHLANCYFCQTMLSSMQPALSRREEFLKVVRDQARFLSVGEFESLTDRLYALCKLTWPIALPGLGILILWIGGQLTSGGWLLTATIKSEAISLLLFLILSVVTAVVAFTVYMNHRPHLPLVAKFVYTVSLTVGATAGLAVVLYTSNEWYDATVALRSSEAVLVKKLADSYETRRQMGVFPAIVDVNRGTQINTVGSGKEFAVYTASSKDFPGALVARAKMDKGQISVDLGGKQFNSLEITIGKVERISEDRYRVTSTNGEFVDGKLANPSQEIPNGVTAMAVKRFGKASLAELHPLGTASLKK